MRKLVEQLLDSQIAEEDLHRSLAQVSGSPTKLPERETSILEEDESEQGTMKIEGKHAILTKHNSMKALPDRASERDQAGKKAFTGG